MAESIDRTNSPKKRGTRSRSISVILFLVLPSALCARNHEASHIPLKEPLKDSLHGLEKKNPPQSTYKLKTKCIEKDLKKHKAIKPRNTPPLIISLPDGFSISVFAEGLNRVRSLAYGKNGSIFAGSVNMNGDVFGLKMRRGSAKKPMAMKVVSGLNNPHGVAFFDNDLYVAEIGRIIRFKDAETSPWPMKNYDVIHNSLPKEAHHGWKTIGFGPDNKLYIAIGAPCNVCDVDDPYASISRMDHNGKYFEVFARGIRNSVGFDWMPDTTELWFTDNGRDNLGDDQPPDELNRATHAGMHFGFPFCHGSTINDPKYGKGRDCSLYEGPKQELQAHAASLGMRFYTGKSFPKRYWNNIFIAEHGSWNRSKKTGYRISFVTIGDNGDMSCEIFAKGWLKDEIGYGRPVALLVLDDGSLIMSDDHAGVLYQISYTP